MKVITTITQDEDGVFVAECPVIPGCISQGRSEEEALANLREAISLCLEVRREKGMPHFVETRELEIAV